MAYAQGAELANQANWADVFRDQESRSNELKLEVSNDAFNTQLEDRLVNEDVARLETGLLDKIKDLPVEQQNTALAEELKKLNFDTSTRAGLRARKLIDDFVTQRAAGAAKAGDTQGALALLQGSRMGGSGAQAADRARVWSDPRNWSSDAFSSEGYALDEATSIVTTPDGRRITKAEAAQDLRNKYLQPFVDRTSIWKTQTDLTKQRLSNDPEYDTVAELFTKQGYDAKYLTRDPVTGKVGISPAVVGLAKLMNKDPLELLRASPAMSEPAPQRPNWSANMSQDPDAQQLDLNKLLAGNTTRGGVPTTQQTLDNISSLTAPAVTATPGALAAGATGSWGQSAAPVTPADIRALNTGRVQVSPKATEEMLVKEVLSKMTQGRDAQLNKAQVNNISKWFGLGQ